MNKDLNMISQILLTDKQLGWHNLQKCGEKVILNEKSVPKSVQVYLAYRRYSHNKKGQTDSIVFQ